MGKRQSKAFKKFRSNKPLVKKTIFGKKIQQIKTREEELKTQKILQSKDEVEEQAPEQLQQQPKKKKSTTGFENDEDENELRSFFSSGFMEQLEKRIVDDDGAPKVQGPAPKKRKISKDGEEAADEDDEDDEAADGSDDDEEGEEEDEEDYVSQITKLAKDDPEFYSYLQQEDAGLLKFAEGAAEEDATSEAEDAQSADEDADEEKAEEQTPADGSHDTEEVKQAKSLIAKKRLLTTATIKLWANNCKESHSATSMKHILLAFRCAVHMNDFADDAPKGSQLEEAPAAAAKNVKRKRKVKPQASVVDKTRNIPFTITSPEVQMDVLIYSMDALLAFFDKEFNRKVGSNDLPDSETVSYIKYGPSVVMFLRSLLHLLAHTVQPESLAVVLKSVDAFVPYFGTFQKHSRRLLKQMLSFLGNQEDTVRFRSFLVIRKLAVCLPFPFLDLCLKGVYLTMVQNSKFYNATSLPLIDFLMNGIIELYGLDFASAYQHAFVYIRQLALTLRTTLDRTAKDSHQVLYNWKYINCLRCWTKVLSAYPLESELRALIYPLVQVIMGVINFSQSPMYYPLRFMCVSMLTDLARASGMFIPAAPYLFPILTSSEVKHKPKLSLKTPIDFLFSLKVADKNTKSREFQNKIVEETLYLILKHLVPYSRSIAFPEMSFPTLVALKKFISNKYAPQMSRKVNGFIEKIEMNSELIYKHRSKVDFTPTDVEKAKAFSENLLADPADKKNKKLQKQKGKSAILAATPLEEYWNQEQIRHDSEIQMRVEGLLGRAMAKKEKAAAAEEESDDEADNGGGYGGVEEFDKEMEIRERIASGELTPEQAAAERQQQHEAEEDDDEIVSDDEEADTNAALNAAAEDEDDMEVEQQKQTAQSGKRKFAASAKIAAEKSEQRNKAAAIAAAAPAAPPKKVFKKSAPAPAKKSASAPRKEFKKSAPAAVGRKDNGNKRKRAD